MGKELKITARAMGDFVPLILLWSIPNQYGLVLGLIVSVILMIIKGIKKEKGLMTKVVFIYLVITNMLYFNFHMSIVFEKRHLISYAILVAMCFISIKKGRPFTMDASKKTYESIEDSALFIEMNNIITAIFGVVYGINMILAYFESSMLPIVSMVLTITAILLSIILPKAMPDV